MKDIVIGAITNYTFDKISPWVNSLDRCGFDGIKILLCSEDRFSLELES